MAQLSPSIEVPMPDISLRVIVTKPSGYGVRMALLTAILWVAGHVAPSNIDVETEIVSKD